jgi:hypothetical protein
MIINPAIIQEYQENDLALNEERPIDFEHRLECVEPGEYEVIFELSSRISTSATMVDPVAENNASKGAFHVTCLAPLA